MSQNLWADFDKKISELSTKADELDGLRVRLEQLPQRLVVIKQQTEVLLRSAKGAMSESLKKEIAKKVVALDKIFKKLEGTKNLSEPLLQKLEGELQKLEDFTKLSAVKIDERAQKQSGNTLDNMKANETLADSALFQEKPVDVIPPPVEKLLDLGPPTKGDYVNPNTIATPATNTIITPKQVTTTPPVNQPGPPEGTKYNYLAKKAAAEAAEVAKAKAAKAAIAKQAAEVAKAKAVEAEEQKAVEVANSEVPKNIQGNIRSARENGGRASFSQGEGEGNQVKNARLSVHDQKKRRRQQPWNSSTKIGGFLSSKKYSHKRRNRKLKSQKRAKLMKRKSKAHKKKASTRRR